jgi:5-methylcytosine-specific restriction endonuclease McrA
VNRLAPSTGEPVAIAPRRKLTPKQRLEVLIAGKGRCEICGEKIIDAFDIDHRVPLALGGADDASNWRALHPDCHLNGKTKEDVTRIAKAKRQEKLRLDVPRTVSAASIPSRPFDKPRRKIARQAR